jgi:Short C-terminal domain
MSWRKKGGGMMARLILGIALMLIAFVILFLFIGGPENQLVADVMTALNCQPGERFTQVLGGYVYDSDGGSGQEFNFYCQNDAGRRDVTRAGILEGVAGFVVPFLLGLGLTMIGGFGMARGRTKITLSANTGFIQPSSTPIQTDPFGKPINVTNFRAGVSGEPFHSSTIITRDGKQASLADLPPETAQLVEQALGKLSMMMNAGGFVVHGGDLADKLRQLQEARDKNLITQDEYERIRKEILDHME